MEKHSVSNFNNTQESSDSLVDLLKKLVSQSSDIVTSEVKLMKAEMIEAGDNVKKGSISLAISLIFIIAGACTTLIGLASLLAETMPQWAAYFALGVPTLIIGGIFLAKGIRNLKTQSLQPQRSIRSVEKDLEVLKGGKQ